MPENKFDLSSINYHEAFLSDRLNDPKIKYSGYDRRRQVDASKGLLPNIRK